MTLYLSQGPDIVTQAAVARGLLVLLAAHLAGTAVLTRRRRRPRLTRHDAGS